MSRADFSVQHLPNNAYFKRKRWGGKIHIYYNSCVEQNVGACVWLCVCMSVCVGAFVCVSECEWGGVVIYTTTPVG